MSNTRNNMHKYGRAPEHRTAEGYIARALVEVHAPISLAGRATYRPQSGSYNGEHSDFHAIAPVVNQLGMHARPAALFVKTASRYDCDVTAFLEEEPTRKVSGKSIMGLLTLQAAQGKTLVIGANGGNPSDAYECVRALGELVERKFGED